MIPKTKIGLAFRQSKLSFKEGVLVEPALMLPTKVTWVGGLRLIDHWNVAGQSERRNIKVLSQRADRIPR